MQYQNANMQFQQFNYPPMMTPYHPMPPHPTPAKVYKSATSDPVTQDLLLKAFPFNPFIRPFMPNPNFTPFKSNIGLDVP
jgi:hypothetical protein